MKRYSDTAAWKYAECAEVVRVGDGATVDEYGNELESTFAERVDVLVEPLASLEDLRGGDRQTARLRLYVDPGADITGHDRVRLRGRLWHVVGEPMDWPNGSVVTVEAVA